MARDLKAFYASRARLRREADAEWAALGASGSFRLTGDLEAWAAELDATGLSWDPPRYDRPAGTGSTAYAALSGRDRAYAAPAVCAAAIRDGVLVAPIPGRIVSAFALRHPEGEYETALGYGFEPEGAPSVLLHAGTAVWFKDFETPGDTPPAAVVVHVLHRVFATLREWTVHVRPSARPD